MHPKDVAQSVAAPAKGPPRGRWGHTPSIVTRLWLFISLPLVIWDTGYVLLRPHSMPGGALHWPLWVPYELYGKVDYVYGWKAFHDHNGFTGAQATLNIVETLFYLYYLSAVPSHGGPRLEGPRAGVAVLVGFSAALMTLSKTVLYGLNEYFSGFDNVGHNSMQDLLLMWIIPNGAWLVLSFYMVYAFGCEILEGLTMAAGATPSSDDKSTVKIE